MKHTLHIFRRDLRLSDNTALLDAMAQSGKVSVCFIFNPRQLIEHPYRSENGLQFMLQALENLRREIMSYGGKLHIWLGDVADILPQICVENQIDAVCWNRDYTPFARVRDKQVRVALMKIADVTEHPDALLTEPEQIQSQQGTPYKVYSFFARECKNYPIRRPKSFIPSVLTSLKKSKYDIDLAYIYKTYLQEKNSYVTAMGNRLEGLGILKDIANYETYKIDRDYPNLNKTTHLAVHHKFGTISIRETYHAVYDAFKEDHALINQLYWRDFYTHVAWHWPRVFTSKSWNPKYENVLWDKTPEALDRWKNGITGFPIVDAGMRQLRTTGYMHNRVRMITACFLTKDLHIHWRAGEQHFAQYLVDYDPCVNNGSWQWAASTGTDAQPYFRIFNPWTQQKRWDADCKYIKKWIPELRNLTPKDIHNWHKMKEGVADLFGESTYPAPMVSHRNEALDAQVRFKMV